MLRTVTAIGTLPASAGDCDELVDDDAEVGMEFSCEFGIEDEDVALPCIVDVWESCALEGKAQIVTVRPRLSRMLS